MKRRNRMALIALALAGSMAASHLAMADTTELYGNTLICSRSENGFTTFLRIFVTPQRAFSSYSSNRSTAKMGTIYEFGRTRSGNAGVNSYESSAQIDAASMTLDATQTIRDCRICDGQTIMVADHLRVAKSGNGWSVSRDFKQWFPSGAEATVPSGAEQYSCKVAHGRVGVGG